MMNPSCIMRFTWAACILAATCSYAAPTADVESLTEMQASGRFVFCHFMVGTQQLMFSYFSLTDNLGIDWYRGRSNQRLRL